MCNQPNQENCEAMTTAENLGTLKADELRTIIRSLKLKTSVKGYSKMRHADLIAELDKHITVKNDGAELLVSLKTPPVATDSLRITLKQTESKKESPAIETVAANVAATTPPPQVKGGEAPAPAAPKKSKKGSKIAATKAELSVPELPTPVDFTNVLDSDDSDIATTSASSKKVKAIAPKKKTAAVRKALPSLETVAQ